MRQFWAVATREIVAVFGTATGWVCAGVFALLSAFSFWIELLSYQEAQLRAQSVGDPALLAMLDFNDLLLAGVYLRSYLLFLLLVPFLALRSFAQEKEKGFLDFLLASPAKTSALVLGKMAGGAAVVVVCSLFLLIFPIVLSLLGTSTQQGDGVVDFGQSLCGIAGVLLFGLFVLFLAHAVASTLSATTTASLVTCLLLLGLWFLGAAAPALRETGASWAVALAPSPHVESFVRGEMRVRDLLYFFSSMIAFFVITHRSVDARRAA